MWHDMICMRTIGSCRRWRRTGRIIHVKRAPAHLSVYVRSACASARARAPPPAWLREGPRVGGRVLGSTPPTPERSLLLSEGGPRSGVGGCASGSGPRWLALRPCGLEPPLTRCGALLLGLSGLPCRGTPRPRSSTHLGSRTRRGGSCAEAARGRAMLVGLMVLEVLPMNFQNLIPTCARAAPPSDAGSASR